MTLVRRVTPFENLVSLRETMDRLFDETLFRPLRFGDGKHETYPLIDLYTTPDAVIAEIAASRSRCWSSSRRPGPPSRTAS